MIEALEMGVGIESVKASLAKVKSLIDDTNGEVAHMTSATAVLWICCCISLGIHGQLMHILCVVLPISLHEKESKGT